MKYLPSIVIALVAIAAYFFWPEPEVTIIDNTKKYEAQKDSLKSVVHLLTKRIEFDALLLEEAKKERDSLKNYQGKIYIYYEKVISDIRSLPDDSVYGEFSRQVRKGSDMGIKESN